MNIYVVIKTVSAQNRVISHPQKMSEVFVRSFSSAFSSVLPQVVNPHQESKTERSQIHMTLDKVISQHIKLD